MQNTENKIKTEDINKDKTSHNQPKKINIKNKKYGNENTIFTELPDNLKILKPIPIKADGTTININSLTLTGKLEEGVLTLRTSFYPGKMPFPIIQIFTSGD